jgi:hypothetical protein
MEEKEKPNKQVLVIQNDDDEDNTPHRWTWAKYGHQINVYKWWVLGITVVCIVAGYLVVHFGVNPSKETVTSQFGYNNIALTSDGNGGGSYVDGTTFDYHNIISSSNIKAVKEANKTEFGSVDTDGLIEKGISIALDQTTNTAGDVVISSPNTYTITATMKYFGSQNTAKDFINALIEIPNTTAQEAVTTNKATNAFLSTFDSQEYEDQLSVLRSQYNILLSRLNTVQAVGGSESTVINASGLTIAQEINIFKENYIYSGNSIFDYLDGQLLAHQFVSYTHTADGRADKISALEAQADASIARIKETFNYQSIYEEQLNNLKTNGQIVTNSQYAEQIAALNDKVTSLKLERQTISTSLKKYGYSVPDTLTKDNVSSIVLDPSADGKIQHLQNPETDNWETKCTEFSNTINKYKTLLSGDDMDIANSAYQYVYKNKKNTVTYSYAGIINASGHVSGLIGVAVGLLVGFLGSSLICAAIGISKDEEKEKQEALKATEIKK